MFGRRRWGTVLALGMSASLAQGGPPESFFERAHREDLETLARSRKAEERARAAEGLGYWSDPTAVAALAQALEDPDAEVRANAARSLRRLHKLAAPARAALRARLDDVPDVAIAAAGALDALGVDREELAPARRRALGHGNPRIRLEAAEGLIDFEPAVALLPPILDEYLRHADAPFADSEGRRRRDAAQGALVRLAKTQDRTLIPMLLARLRPSTPGRTGILRALAVFAPPPDDWREILISLLEVMDTPTQAEAIAQLEKLTEEADLRSRVPAVGRLLANRGLRGDAMRALAEAGPIASEQAPAIARLVLKGNDHERRTAAEALGRIGDRTAPGTRAEKDAVARAALPALQEALREELSPETCAEAARALDKLQVDPAAASAALADGLHGACTGAALWALGRQGGAAQPVLQAFLPRAGARRADVEKALAVAASARAAAPSPSAIGTTDPQAEARGHSYLRERAVRFEESAFLVAVMEADVPLVSAFLDGGMSPDHAFTSTEAQAPLNVLFRLGKCDARVRPTPGGVRATAERLLASGADVNRGDANGVTPLMDAAAHGCDRAIVRTLIEAGARVGEKGKSGLTAFELGLPDAHDGLEELIAAGFRLPAKQARELAAAYGDNQRALALVRKASARDTPAGKGDRRAGASRAPAAARTPDR